MKINQQVIAFKVYGMFIKMGTNNSGHNEDTGTNSSIYYQPSLRCTAR